jgi:hypothetical protein
MINEEKNYLELTLGGTVVGLGPIESMAKGLLDAHKKYNKLGPLRLGMLDGELMARFEVITVERLNEKFDPYFRLMEEVDSLTGGEAEKYAKDQVVKTARILIKKLSTQILIQASNEGIVEV